MNIKPFQKTWIINKAKQHCKHGHEFNTENTYMTSQGKRQCKACKARRFKQWRIDNEHILKGIDP